MLQRGQRRLLLQLKLLFGGLFWLGCFFQRRGELAGQVLLRRCRLLLRVENGGHDLLDRRFLLELLGGGGAGWLQGRVRGLLVGGGEQQRGRQRFWLVAFLVLECVQVECLRVLLLRGHGCLAGRRLRRLKRVALDSRD